MRNLRNREFVLLLLPALALAGFALFAGRRDRTPFALAVQEVRREVLTPREVAEGFDTKLAVVLGHKGAAPDWWGAPPDWRKPPVYAVLESLAGPRGFFSGGKRYPTAPDDIRGLNRISPQYSKHEGAYVIQYLMRVNKVPAKVGRAVFRTSLRMTRQEMAPKPSITTIASVPVSFVVRQDGEKIKLPPVAKHHPFDVLNFRYRPPAAGDPTARMEVTVRYKGLNPQARFTVSPSDGELIDHAGNVHQAEQSGSGLLSALGANKDKTLHHLQFGFPAKTLPIKGKLTFRAKLSVDDCWPLVVSKVVRR